MVGPSPPGVLDAVLEHLAGSFRLDHEIGGRTLRSLLEDTVRELADVDLPAWGEAVVDTPDLVHVTDGPLTFAYRPHLFPGMSADLRLGHEVQFHLLPRTLPIDAPVEVAAVLESYCHLSGDLFGWRTEPDGRFTVWVIDVSGHGVRAGFAAVVLKLLIAQADPGLPLDRLVRWVEDRFVAARAPDDRRCLYATGLFVTVDAAGGMEYVSAGHPPLLVSDGSGRVATHESTGPPIGLIPGRPLACRDLRLGRDDVAVLYTDGLVEAHGRAVDAMGLEGLVEVVGGLRGRPSEMVVRVLDRLAASVDTDRLDDDVSLLVMRRRPAVVS